MLLVYLCVPKHHTMRGGEGCRVKPACILDFHLGGRVGYFFGLSCDNKRSVDTKQTEGWVLHNHSGHGVEEHFLLIPENEPPAVPSLIAISLHDYIERS